MMFTLKFYPIIFNIIWLPLIIAGKPKLLPFSNNPIELIENMTYPLNCIIISGTKPLMFEWFQNGNKLFNKINFKIDNHEQVSTLSLSNVQQSFAGKYECQAKNEFGSDTISTNILIKGLKIFKLITLNNYHFVLEPKCGAI